MFYIIGFNRYEIHTAMNWTHSMSIMLYNMVYTVYIMRSMLGHKTGLTKILYFSLLVINFSLISIIKVPAYWTFFVVSTTLVQ